MLDSTLSKYGRSWVFHKSGGNLSKETGKLKLSAFFEIEGFRSGIWSEEGKVQDPYKP